MPATSAAARRVELELPDAGRVPVMALADLVQAKKTQRDKDCPMIRRLVEADYHRRGSAVAHDRVAFWLEEGRTAEILAALVRAHPDLARGVAERRPVVGAILAGDLAAAHRLLREEEDRERELDRQYWAPLRAELETWRRARGRATSSPG